ncbi:MAG: LysR family transcriptional regulator [Nevskiales bacterium]|nr:LysR family transcriptional regulator [Nevskiales bacterium]
MYKTHTLQGHGMNLNHLAIFHAVATCNSVSSGAQRLHISQSAASKQLIEFEQSLGLRLFDRLPRGVRLTEAGQLLLGHANRLFAIEAQAEHALIDLRDHARGQLRIGASRTTGSYLLPEHLAAFHQRHPGMEIQLQVANTRAVESGLLAGEIDIGFTEGIVANEQLEYTEFARDELVLVAAPDHPAVDCAPLAPGDLTRWSLLMHEEGSGTRAVTELALARRKLHIKPAMRLASGSAIKLTVAAGGGLAFLSSLAVRTEVLAGRLVVLPVKKMRIERTLYRVCLRNVSPGPSLQAFLETLGTAREQRHKTAE